MRTSLSPMTARQIVCGVGTATLALAALPAFPTFGAAQQKPDALAGVKPAASREPLISLDARNASLALVLSQILDRTQANYTVDPALANFKVLSVTLHNVPLRVALKALVRSSDHPFSYILEDGVYTFLPGGGEASNPPAPPKPVEAIELSHDLAINRFSLDAENASLYVTLTELLKHSGVNYTLDPALKQYTVTAHLKNITLHQALDALIKQAGTPLTWRVTDSVYEVMPPKAGEKAAPAPKSGAERGPIIEDKILPVADNKDGRITMDADNVSLYYVVGAILKTMKINYTVSPELKPEMVSAHLVSIPWKTALEMLFKQAGKPFFLRVKDDVYEVVPGDSKTGKGL